MRETEVHTCDNDRCKYTGEEAVLVTTPLLLKIKTAEERKGKGGAKRRRRGGGGGGGRGEGGEAKAGVARQQWEGGA